MGEQRVLRILMVEDDPSDARLLQEATSETQPWCEIIRADTGAQALDILFQRGKYKDQPCPDLILLDLNLPIVTGFEVLNAIKANHRLNLIPVLVLSTSSNPADIQTSYNLGAACYIIKPPLLADWSGLANALRAFWFDSVTLPTRLGASTS